MALTSACATRSNYLDPEGPRYAANYASRPGLMTSFAPGSATADGGPGVHGEASGVETLKVVSYNLRYGIEVDAAIDLLARTPELADTDVFLLQEMHAYGVDRIAHALGCSYVYYPASLRTSGRDFGNAVLTRGRIVGDEKVLLPHVNPFNRQQRIAVRTNLEVEGNALAAFSVHTETPFLPEHRRAEQINALLSSAPAGHLPCLIAGDFNTMSAHSLQRLATRFSELGFERASEDVGSTFSFGPLAYPLDHVFVRGLEVLRAGKVESANASDHVPIWVELAWPPRVHPPS